MMPPGKAISSFVIAVCFDACIAADDKSSNSNSFPSVRKKILNGVRVAEREKRKINRLFHRNCPQRQTPFLVDGIPFWLMNPLVDEI